MYHPLFTNIQGKKILDLGFGNGKAALYFAQKNTVLAVEKNPRLIKRLGGQNHPNITLIQDDAVRFCHTLAAEGKQFDLIMARNILPFLSSKKVITEVLHTVQKILAPGGFVFVTFFGRKDEWFGNKEDMVFLSKKEIEEILCTTHYQDSMDILEKIYEAEERGVKPTMHNTLKYWHIYNFVFQRPLPVVKK